MSRAATDPRFAEIESHRAYLVRYALSQLRDSELAEEAVQETLLAALEGIDRFDRRSTLRTWLTSILRFKVIDLQRRLVADRARVQYDEATVSAEHEAWLDEMFDETGHWRSPPQAWNDPEAAFEQRRFWEVFERCLGRLPDMGGPRLLQARGDGRGDRRHLPRRGNHVLELLGDPAPRAHRPSHVPRAELVRHRGTSWALKTTT